MKNSVAEFTNQLNRDLAKMHVGPASPFDVQIESTLEADLSDPIQAVLHPNRALRLERARQVLTAFHRSPRDRSRGNDTRGVEQRLSHEEAEEELSADDQALVDRVMRDARRGGPLFIAEGVSTGAGKRGRFVEQFAGDPKQDARAWLADMERPLANRQKDASSRPWWAILQKEVSSLPAGATVGDLEPKLLDVCLKELCSNKI